MAIQKNLKKNATSNDRILQKKVKFDPQNLISIVFKVSPSLCCGWLSLFRQGLGLFVAIPLIWVKFGYRYPLANRKN